MSTIATNTDSKARRSDSFVRTNPSGSARCSHIWLSASRRLDIQPSPAQAAVASPMTPTAPREEIAESINCTSCVPKSPDTVSLMRCSMSAIRCGRLANTKPPAANPTIRSGNRANTVKYVMPAA